MRIVLLATRYECDGLMDFGAHDFLLPRFDGSFMNAEHHVVKEQRNLVAKFVVGIKEGEEVKEKVITLEKNNTEHCFFDIGADTWKDC